jgi:hypothetical protein
LKRARQAVSFAITGGVAIPALSSLSWLILFYSFSVSSSALAYAITAAGVAGGYLSLLPVLRTQQLRIGAGLLYLPIAAGWCWLVGVVGACHLYSDCL